MKKQLPARANLRQLRTQAKELLTQLPAGSKLADAQLEVARSYGFESWPKLVHHIELPSLKVQIRSAIEKGDEDSVRRLLETNSSLRECINEPMMDFDSPLFVWASQFESSAPILRSLVRFGANPNARSQWWAGGFSALDLCAPALVEDIIELGATFDVWSAARHNQISELNEILIKSPEQLDAPGGDGKTPLHFAGSAETAQFLLSSGAALDLKDVDHESTALQHHINNPQIVRVLVEAGAEADAFAAAVLDDVNLLRTLLQKNPNCVHEKVGELPYKTIKSNGGHIYSYLLGNGMTPLHLAAAKRSQGFLHEVWASLRPEDQLIAAAQLEDESLVHEILTKFPGLKGSTGHHSRTIADAAQHGKTNLVRILLGAGFDPNAPGMDGGSALHIAAWFGYVEIVRMLLGRVPIDLRDSVHGSTPLGWAAHGSHWCKNPKGDYPSTVRAILEAGADVCLPANSAGTSILDQAGSRDDIKVILREFGAK